MTVVEDEASLAATHLTTTAADGVQPSVEVVVAMSGMDIRTDDVLAQSSSLSVRDGRLWLEETDLTALAARFGTPSFVISEAQLRSNARAYREAFSQRWGRVDILSALKANPNLALRRILNAEEIGCDIFGPAELELALRSGLDATRISANGSAKSSEFVARAVAVGAHLVIDSRRELHLAIDAATRNDSVAKVRLRLRPDLIGEEELSDLTRSEMTIKQAAARYKLGIANDEFGSCIALAASSDNVDLSGVHIHSGRHTHRLDLRVAIVQSAVRSIERIRTVVGPDWSPREIDLGGG